MILVQINVQFLIAWVGSFESDLNLNRNRNFKIQVSLNFVVFPVFFKEFYRNLNALGSIQ